MAIGKTMALKKKKSASSKNTPSQPIRLSRAKNWLATYNGKNLVRGYSKHFRVDMLCAVKELRLSGVDVSEEYELSLKQNLAARALAKTRKKEQLDLENLMSGEFDDNFEFIAGYTSGGAPYGITKDEIIS